MIVAVDVGNTNISIGIFRGDHVVANYRLTAVAKRTSDEYGFLLISFLSNAKIHVNDVEDVIVSSVVPEIMHSFNNSIRKYLKKEPIIVGPGIKTGISIRIDNPRELGSDRIVDAVGAYNVYGGNVLVVDFGTATTFDYINENGEFLGGATSPGIEISSQALSSRTSKLPDIQIKPVSKILATNTIDSMQAGVFFGYLGHTEYIIKKLKQDVAPNMKVVATGGLGRIIHEHTSEIDVYDPDLTFKGLKIIYDKLK